MDTAMIGALLKAYGAPNSPENINALQQRYANDPTAAERKIYGLQGQSDESGGSRDAILNMMIDQTIPEGVVNVGAPVMETVANASVPTQRSATAARQSVNPRQLSNSAPSSGDPLANEVNQRTPANPAVATPDSGSSGWEWLLPLLGIAAKRIPSPVDMATQRGGLPTDYMGPEATYAGPMNKNVQKYPYGVSKTERIAKDSPNGDPGSTLMADVKKIPQDERFYPYDERAPGWYPEDNNAIREHYIDQSAKGIPQVHPMDNRAPSTVTGSPENEVLARKAQLQAELDAGNKEADAIMKQMRRQKGGGGRNWAPETIRRGRGK